MKKHRGVIISRLVAASAPLFFAGSIGAATDAEIYHGFAAGNPDLATEFRSDSVVSGTQPGVGDSFDSYGDWVEGNPDLYSSVDGGSERSDRTPSVELDIYPGFGEGNADL